jgi:type IV pilus assembly protein PilF
MRTTITLALAMLLAAGCASSGPEAPTVDSGPIIAEPGDARNRARIHTELAAAYYGRGNMGVALEELRIATAADANYAPAHSMFGLVYMDLKETRLAEQSFERALKLAPNDAEINHNYGWFLCQTQREPDSIKYFMQAIRNPLYATPWRSYSAAGVCALRRDNVKEAEQYFERALRLEPDEPASLLQLGQIRYRQGRMDEARRLVARHNKVVSPTAESLWLALRVERRLGQRVAEQSYANQLRRRFPGSPEYQALVKGKFD